MILRDWSKLTLEELALARVVAIGEGGHADAMALNSADGLDAYLVKAKADGVVDAAELQTITIYKRALARWQFRVTEAASFQAAIERAMLKLAPDIGLTAPKVAV